MRELSKSVALAVLFLMFTGVRHTGFMAVFFAPFIIVGLIRRSFLFWKKSDQRRLHASVMGIWIGALAVFAGAHAYYFHSTRSSAESVLESVVRYKENNDTYPPTIDVLGRKQGQDGVFYGVENGSPHLFHLATFTPFDIYNFDFKLGRWVFYAD